MSALLDRFLPFETAVIKDIERADSVELKFRLPALAIGTLLAVLAFGLWEVFAWLAIRLVVLAVFLTYVKNLPEAIDKPRIFALSAMTFLDSAVHTAIGVYLWTFGDPVLTVAGLAVVIAAMLNTAWTKSACGFLWSIEAAVIALGLLGMTVVFAMRGGDFVDTGLIFVSFTMLYIYFVMSLLVIWRNRLKLRLSQQAEVERAKLGAVGTVTGGVAHDFNNLLTTILGNIELARMEGDPAERDVLLSEAHKAGVHGADLIAHLMDFVKKTRLSPEYTEVKSICQRLGPLVSRTIGKNHSVKVDIPANIPGIYVDAGKIQAVLLNLVMNACDSMPDGGVVHFAAARTRALGKDSISLSITDTGVGIPRHMLDKVFEPYVTLKPFGEATGLGLSMSKGVAEQSGGKIDIQSEPGQGTTVTLHLPAVVKA